MKNSLKIFSIVSTILSYGPLLGMEQSTSQPLFKPQETCLISGTEFDGEQCQVIKQYTYFADALDPQKPVLDDWNGDAIMCYNQLNEALKNNNDKVSIQFLQENTKDIKHLNANVHDVMQKYDNYKGTLYKTTLKNNKNFKIKLLIGEELVGEQTIPFFVNESHLKKIETDTAKK